MFFWNEFKMAQEPGTKSWTSLYGHSLCSKQRAKKCPCIYQGGDSASGSQDTVILDKTRYKEASGGNHIIKICEQITRMHLKELEHWLICLLQLENKRKRSILKMYLKHSKRPYILKKVFFFYLLPEKNNPEESHCFKMFWSHLISRLKGRSILLPDPHSVCYGTCDLNWRAQCRRPQMDLLGMWRVGWRNVLVNSSGGCE